MIIEWPDNVWFIGKDHSCNKYVPLVLSLVSVLFENIFGLGQNRWWKKMIGNKTGLNGRMCFLINSGQWPFQLARLPKPPCLMMNQDQKVLIVPIWPIPTPFQNSFFTIISYIHDFHYSYEVTEKLYSGDSKWGW